MQALVIASGGVAEHAAGVGSGTCKAPRWLVCLLRARIRAAPSATKYLRSRIFSQPLPASSRPAVPPPPFPFPWCKLQFDFLKPTHYLFPYFTSLVDAYSKCLAPPHDLREKLATDSQVCTARLHCTYTQDALPQAPTSAFSGAPQDPTKVLRRMFQYASFFREKEQEKLSRENAEDAERRANLLIDWHDFVVS